MNDKIELRQLWHCQNSHPRFAYFTVFTQKVNDADPGDTDMALKWGPRNCDCNFVGLGEGFAPAGPLELGTGIADKKGVGIYAGDIILRDGRFYEEVFWEKGAFHTRIVAPAHLTTHEHRGIVYDNLKYWREQGVEVFCHLSELPTKKKELEANNGQKT